MTKKIKGLYAITPDLANTSLLVEQVRAALQGGTSVLQYRNKTAPAALRREQAAALLALCHEYGVPFIINDHPELCRELDADGVHLGGGDGAIATARALIGADKLIGVSCYNRFALAIQAKAQGADYVAFGSCFASSTKPAAVHAPLTLFARTRGEIDLPTVAIGGIMAENANKVVEAGAEAIAVVSGLFAAEDIQGTARTLAGLFR